MKHLRWLLLAVFLVPLTLGAQTLSIVPRGETLQNNTFRTGERVDIDGTVEGDAFLFGETVTVNGTVKGDVIALAGKVVIDGTVGGSVRAAAQDITITGSVGRNVTIAAQHIIVGSDATIAGSFGVAGQTLSFNGQVGGSLDGAVSSATIGGTVALDANIHSSVPGDSKVSSVVVKSTAVIGGAFIHTGRPTATIETGATIAKGVTEHDKVVDHGPTWSRFVTMWRLAMEFGLVLFGLILLWLFKRHVFAITEEMRHRLGMNALLGVAVLILVPIAVPLLFVTLIGVPIGIVLLGVYLLGLYLTKFFMALVIGEWLTKQAARRKIRLPHSRVFAFLLGLVTLFVVFDLILGANFSGSLKVVNTIGSIIWFLAALWALGAMVRGSWRELRQHG